MRKLLILLIVLGMTSGISLAQEVTITEEVRPSLTKGRIDRIIIYPEKTVAIFSVKKGYLEGEEFVEVQTEKVIFEDSETIVEDDPETEEDESLQSVIVTDYTDLMKQINFNWTNIKQMIITKLGG